MIVDIDRFRDMSRRAQAGFAATLLAALTVIPVLTPGSALAAPTLAERKLVSTTARPSAAADLTWEFNTPVDAGTVEFIEIEFCDSPLGPCGVGAVNGTDNTTVAADNIPILPNTVTATIGGPGDWAAAANTATRVNGRAGATGNQININVTTGFDGSNASGVSIAIPGFTNDEEVNASYYTRVRMFSNDTPNVTTNMIYEGVFAQSTSQTLTVNARVQERLDFCVGSTTVNDDTTDPTAGPNNNCSSITGSSVDLGNVENGAVNVTPVDPVNGGDNRNGIAMLRTNAFNGVVVDYKAIQDTGSGALKVPGAVCGDLTPVTGVLTDRCFQSSSTKGQITAGAERFGMTVAGINCGSSVAYGCDFGSGVYNLIRDAAYNGDTTNTFVTDANQNPAPTTAAGYAWDASGNTDRIAGSTTVVDDEALILKFAATAGVTTPTGAYTVQADFIATATF